VSGSAPITVIVPVYGGRAATGRCLDSLVRHAESCTTPFEVLVIDDCSPDEMLRDDVERFAGTAGPVSVTAMRNPTNLGFVGSVNRGMQATIGDVVLLNSDTVVTEGWLDRLSAVASSSPDVATVTPLTNAGSICTLPARIVERFGLAGPDPRIDECGSFVTRYGLGDHPAVISGVGFCMLITREALDHVGYFDVETFGRGYGEEVDFCLRATQLGYTHLVDDRTFVFHEEGTSFGGTRATGLARGNAILRERYPFFAPANRRERADEPLAVTFEALVLALDQREPERRHVLHLLHAPSTPAGGTERHVDALTAALSDQIDSSILLPVESGFLLRSRIMNQAGEQVTLDHLLPGAAARVTKVDDEVAGAALQMALDLYDFDAIHIHNLLGHSLAPLRVCLSFPGPVVCTLHDLYLACPNYSLLYRDRRACGLPEDLAVCAACLPHTKVGKPVDYLLEFRAVASEHLDAIDRFVVGDITAADYLRRVYDVAEDRVEVIEHGSLLDGSEPGALDVQHVLAGPLRLAFAGRGWHRKGLGVVNQLATELAGSGIELHHFGEAIETVAPEVHAHGSYENVDLPRLLHEAGIHIVLLPGPYAETYSYVMSEAIASGLPVIGAGYGALGHRIRTHGVGWTIDPEDTTGVRELLTNLDRCRPEVLRATRRARELSISHTREVAQRYTALYLDANRPALDANRPAPDAGATRNAESTMTDDDEMQRRLRALSAVNWRLHAQIGERPRTRGARFATLVRDLVERMAPRAFRWLETGFEAIATIRELVSSARSSVRRRSKS
jgi:GT2 family glycosyltransferase/glycosyltransferase involved in cell wall biosynthesis